MRDDSFPHIVRLFNDLRTRSPSERERILDSDPAADTEIRREVSELLAAHDQPRDPLLQEGGLRGLERPGGDADRVGQHFGPYLLVSVIGSGGMGTVYLARRIDERFPGQMAVKVIKRGMDTLEILERFRREQEILGTLRSHPHIVHLENAGETADGCSYFVMEYIDGQPIDRYCDDPSRCLSVRERLRLFLDVCGAVASAHQRTIVHRDIKPSNVLVSRNGVPKLLDFGIAKVLLSRSLGRTTSVVSSLGLMSVAYASPEQVRGEQVDTRSDVYSVGVLLYCLLTGCHPYGLDGLSDRECADIICERTPPLPSWSVQSAAPVLQAELAGKRSTTPVGLRRQLQGDLDNILLRALQKDPERRYASVAAFDADIRNFLNGRPVVARRDTLTYRVGKFITRHRSGVLAAAALALVIAAGVAGVAWQAQVARRERARAERRFNDVRRLANSFLFEFHDAIDNLPGSTAARQLVVKRALEYLDSLAAESADDVALQLELAVSYMRIGDVQGYPNDANEGDLNAASASYRRAEQICERAVQAAPGLTPPRVRLAIIRQRIGEIQSATGRSADGLRLQRMAIAQFEAIIRDGAADKLTRRALAVGYTKAGEALEQMGRLDEALNEYRRSSALFSTLQAESPGDREARRDITVSFSKFGDIQRLTGDLKGALLSYQAGLRLREEAIKNNPTDGEIQRDLASSYDRIGLVLSDLQQFEDALTFHRKALAIDTTLLASDRDNVDARRDVAGDQANIGDMLGRLNRWSDALATRQIALKMRRDVYEVARANHEVREELSQSYGAVCEALAHAGDYSAAWTHCETGATLAEASHQSDPDNVQFAEAVALSYAKAGRLFALWAQSLGRREDGRAQQQACSWYKRAVDEFTLVQRRATITLRSRGARDEAMAALAARCGPAAGHSADHDALPNRLRP